MKKFAFVFAALAACFAISCTKEVADDAHRVVCRQ